MKRLTRHACIGLALTANAVLFATSAGAYEETNLGKTLPYSLQMNPSGQYLLVTHPNGDGLPIHTFSGDAQNPLPAPIDLALTSTTQDYTVGVAGGVAPDGTRLVTWQFMSPSRSGPVPTAATFGADASAAIQTSLDPTPRSVEFFENNQLAIGPNSTAVQYWAWSSGRGATKLLASTRPPGGSFEPAKEMYSVKAKVEIRDLVAKLDANGVPTFVWDRSPLSCRRSDGRCRYPTPSIQIATGDGAGGIASVQTLHGVDECQPPVFDEAPSGAAIIAAECWHRGDLIMYSTRAPGQSFTKFKRANAKSGLRDDFPAVAMTPDDRALLAWRHFPRRSCCHKNTISTINASVSVAGSMLSAPRALTPQLSTMDPDPMDSHAPTPALAIGRSGQPYVEGRLQNDQQLRVAAVHPDLTLGQSVPVAPSGDPLDFVLSDSGRGMASWFTAKGMWPIFHVSQFDAPAP